MELSQQKVGELYLLAFFFTYVFSHGTAKRIFINFPNGEVFQHWPRHYSFSVNRTLNMRIQTRSLAHNAENTKELFTLCVHFLTCFLKQFHSAMKAKYQSPTAQHLNAASCSISFYVFFIVSKLLAYGMC